MSYRPCPLGRFSRRSSPVRTSTTTTTDAHLGSILAFCSDSWSEWTRSTPSSARRFGPSPLAATSWRLPFKMSRSSGTSVPARPRSTAGWDWPATLPVTNVSPATPYLHQVLKQPVDLCAWHVCPSYAGSREEFQLRCRSFSAGSAWTLFRAHVSVEIMWSRDSSELRCSSVRPTALPSR
jgi:hypothetical protein